MQPPTCLVSPLRSRPFQTKIKAQRYLEVRCDAPYENGTSESGHVTEHVADEAAPQEPLAAFFGNKERHFHRAVRDRILQIAALTFLFRDSTTHFREARIIKHESGHRPPVAGLGLVMEPLGGIPFFDQSGRKDADGAAQDHGAPLVSDGLKCPCVQLWDTCQG
jgi:hypothetical protein